MHAFASRSLDNTFPVFLLLASHALHLDFFLGLLCGKFYSGNYQIFHAEFSAEAISILFVPLSKSKFKIVLDFAAVSVRPTIFHLGSVHIYFFDRLCSYLFCRKKKQYYDLKHMAYCTVLVPSFC